MTTKTRKPWLANLVWATALLVVFGPVLYVLSYAPVYRWRCDSAWNAGRKTPYHLTGYGPAEWTIDETPLCEPLILWGKVWGIGDAMGWASYVRSQLRVENAP